MNQIFDFTRGLLLFGGATTGQSFTALNQNLLINPDFSIAQRGVSFSATGYAVDRWYLDLGGSTGTLSRQTLTPGADILPGNPHYYMRLAITSAVGVAGIEQRVEGVRTVQGGAVTASFWARASESTSMSVSLTQDFGSGGSAAVTGIGAASVTIGTAWARHEVTISVPGLAGKTVGADDYLALIIAQASAATIASLDLALIKLEIGAAATDWLPRLPGEELALCRRYYRQIDHPGAYNQWVVGVAVSSTQVTASYVTGDPMRVNPSTSTSPAINFSIWDGSHHTCSSIYIHPRYGGSEIEIVVLDSGGSYTVQQAYYIAFRTGLDGWITLDAEL